MIGEFKKSFQVDFLYQLFAAGFLILFFFLRDIPIIRRESHTASWKLLYIFVIFIILFACIISIALINAFDLSILLPDLENVRDGLWTALFVAIVVALFIKATNMASNYSRPSEDRVATNQKVILNQQRKLEEQFGSDIEAAASANDVNERLMMAILVFESLNRPKILRIAENLIVRVFPVELTAGIAQVKTRRPLSDVESIKLMGEELGEYKKSLNLTDMSSEDVANALIRYYNDSWAYFDSIHAILKMMH